jgi:acetyl esterase/lipase
MFRKVEASMPDTAGLDPVARDAIESESLFSRPVVRPDATASYGDHSDQVIDFYAPKGEGEERAPLVVVLHGGAWRNRYDRAYISPFADFLAGRGFAVASVEYRRGPAVPAESDGVPPAGRWPDTFDDVATAMDALPRLAAELVPQADTGRIVVTGHSAGGHLALWAAARHVLPEDSPWRLPSAPPLRGVIALGPIADLVRSIELDVCGGAVVQLLGGEDEFGRRLESADPAALLPTGIATTIVQGRRDITVPCAVPEAFVEAAARAGETVGLTIIEDVGHTPLVDPSADACAIVAEEIAQLAW